MLGVHNFLNVINIPEKKQFTFEKVAFQGYWAISFLIYT